MLAPSSLMELVSWILLPPWALCYLHAGVTHSDTSAFQSSERWNCLVSSHRGLETYVRH